MKERKLVVILSALMILASVNFAYALDKYAYVNVLKIATEYSKAKDYNKAIEDKAKAYESEVEKKINDIKNIQDKFSLLSDKERAAKRGELEQKIKALQDFRKDKETELRKKNFENSKEVADDVRAAIKQVADKEGYTLVFDDGALVFQNKDMDITDKVISILNKR
jgi:outer membrane protein